jgi:hypothetical protein
MDDEGEGRRAARIAGQQRQRQRSDQTPAHTCGRTHTNSLPLLLVRLSVHAASS